MLNLYAVDQFVNYEFINFTSHTFHVTISPIIERTLKDMKRLKNYNHTIYASYLGYIT